MTRNRASAYARIEVLLLPSEIPNSNARGHWSIGARKRAKMRNLAGNLAMVERVTNGAVKCPVALTLTFDFPTKARRDLDNIEVKGLIDGLVDGGLLTDDDDTRIVTVIRQRGGSAVPKGYTRITAELRHLEPQLGGQRD